MDGLHRCENFFNDIGEKIELPLFTYKTLCTDIIRLFNGPIVVVVAQKNHRDIVVETLHELNEVETAYRWHGNINDYELVWILG